MIPDYRQAENQLVNKNFAESKKEIGVIAFGSNFHTHIPEAFKKELGKILNDPEIKNSFQ